MESVKITRTVYNIRNTRYCYNPNTITFNEVIELISFGNTYMVFKKNRARDEISILTLQTDGSFSEFGSNDALVPKSYRLKNDEYMLSIFI